MALKFVLYQLVCITSIVLLSIFLVYLGYSTLSSSNIHFEGGIFGVFILLAYFGLFFGNNFLGLLLYKKLVHHLDVSKKEIATIKLFFFIQLLMQAFSVILQLINIEDLLRKVRRLYFSPHRSDILVFDVVPAVIILLTFYYEVFTFPLIKEIKKRYAASQSDLTSIGEGIP